MSKHRYSSSEFNRVDWDSLVQRLAGGRAVLPVDAAKQDYAAAVLAGDGTVLARFKWVHPQQTAAVVQPVHWLAQRVRVEVVMEPSGTYGDALLWQLRQAGIALYRVSPKRVHDAAEVFDGVPSLHDAKAADLIGRLHLQGASQPWQEPSAERREVTAELTQLRICKGHYQAELNRLEAYLSRHWPESLAILDLGSASLSELIAVYGDAPAVSADLPGAAALLRRVGHMGLSAEKIQALLGSAAHSLGVPALGAERALLQWLAADINATRKQLHALERQIEQRVAGTPELARLGAVTGKVTAAVLLAALGRPQDYPDAASYTLRHRAQPNAAAASTRDSSRSPSAAAAWRASTSTSPPYA